MDKAPVGKGSLIYLGMLILACGVFAGTVHTSVPDNLTIVLMACIE